MTCWTRAARAHRNVRIDAIDAECDAGVAGDRWAPIPEAVLVALNELRQSVAFRIARATLIYVSRNGGAERAATGMAGACHCSTLVDFCQQ
jgi:hypothetical protein